LDEGAVTPEAKKKIKECKDSAQIGRIIGYRHNYFSSQKKIKLECLSTKSFSFGPRSPKYLTLGVRGLENNCSINEGDNQGDIDSNGVMTVDVEVTGQSTPLIVCLKDVREVFVIHVGGPRCVTSSTDQILKRRARITCTVDCIRTCIFDLFS